MFQVPKTGPGAPVVLDWIQRQSVEVLVLDGPHRPTEDDDCADEEGEAEGAEANHHSGLGALRDAEDHGDAQCEEQHGGEVGQHQSEAFLPLAKECASMAAITFRRPPTTRNFVP